jgi:predicted transposase/invertase (TIGR01784 family)
MPITFDPHDRFFKETFGKVSIAGPFFQRVLPPALAAQIDWQALKCIDGDFLDEKLTHRSADLLFTAPWQDSNLLLYCLFEHQSTCDPLMPLRLLRYMVNIWGKWLKDNPKTKSLPLIIPMVLYQGKGKWTAPSDMRGMIALPKESHSDWQTFVPAFTYTVIPVNQDDILNRFSDWHSRHILELLATALVRNDVQRLKQAFKALEAIAKDGDDDLAYLRTALTYLFSVSGDVDKNLFEAQIKELNDNQLKKEAMSIAELLKQEGRQEGILQSRQDDVVEVLELRFNAVPSGLIEAVRAVRDEAHLRKLHRAAIQATDLESFTQAL